MNPEETTITQVRIGLGFPWDATGLCFDSKEVAERRKHREAIEQRLEQEDKEAKAKLDQHFRQGAKSDDDNEEAELKEHYMVFRVVFSEGAQMACIFEIDLLILKQWPNLAPFFLLWQPGGSGSGSGNNPEPFELNLKVSFETFTCYLSYLNQRLLFKPAKDSDISSSLPYQAHFAGLDSSGLNQLHYCSIFFGDEQLEKDLARYLALSLQREYLEKMPLILAAKAFRKRYGLPELGEAEIQALAKLVPSSLLPTMSVNVRGSSTEEEEIPLSKS